MGDKWGTYRDLVTIEEDKVGLKGREETSEFVSDWFQYFQINKIFKTNNLFLFAPAMARIAYVKMWKEKARLTKDQWLFKLIEFIESTNMTATIRNMDKKIIISEWELLEKYFLKRGIMLNIQAGIDL